MKNFKLQETYLLNRRVGRLTKLIHMDAPSIIVAKEMQFVLRTIARIAHEIKPMLDASSVGKHELDDFFTPYLMEMAQHAKQEWEDLDDESKEGRMVWSVQSLDETIQDLQKIRAQYVLTEKSE